MKNYSFVLCKGKSKKKFLMSAHFRHVSGKAVRILNTIYPEPWHLTTERLFIHGNVWLPQGLWKEPSKTCLLLRCQQADHDIHQNHCLTVPEKLENKGFSIPQVKLILRGIQHYTVGELPPYLYIEDYNIIEMLASRCP